jgi:GT2 family glycosyltransferase
MAAEPAVAAPPGEPAPAPSPPPLPEPEPMDGILVVYEQGALALAAIRELLTWTPGLRLRVIDNASPTPVAPRLAPLLGPPHRVERWDENVGYGGAVARALTEATTPLVVLASADVLVGPFWWVPCVAAIRHYGAAWAAPSLAVTNRVEPEATWAALGAGSGPWRFEWGSFHGALAVLNWELLRERVGPWDAQFFVAYGDSDYAERMADAGCRTVVVGGVDCLHLEGASGRAIGPEAAAALHFADYTRFRQKWAARPDVLARHQLDHADAAAMAAYLRTRWAAVGLSWTEPPPARS